MSEQTAPQPRRKRVPTRLKFVTEVTVTYVPLPPEKIPAYRAALRWFYRDRSKDKPAD